MGIALGIQRMKEVKRTAKKAKIDPAMQDYDDFDVDGEPEPTKTVRLSELDCARLSLEELEYIDRSKNYVLPNSAKLKVAEYRKVYNIQSPEEEKQERLQEEIEWREKQAVEAWQRRHRQIQEHIKNLTPQEKPKPKESVEPSIAALSFDFDKKYNKESKTTTEQ